MKRTINSASSPSQNRCSFNGTPPTRLDQEQRSWLLAVAISPHIFIVDEIQAIGYFTFSRPYEGSIPNLDLHGRLHDDLSTFQATHS